MGQILDRINKENDIKKIDSAKYSELAEEIRAFLIDKVSKTGGHLASNLGTVELTIALHSVLELPKDKIVWDVGHQAYTHKILTGRKEQFDRLRQIDGLSGFPKRHESACDTFDTDIGIFNTSAYICIINGFFLQIPPEAKTSFILTPYFTNCSTFTLVPKAILSIKAL